MFIRHWSSATFYLDGSASEKVEGEVHPFWGSQDIEIDISQIKRVGKIALYRARAESKTKCTHLISVLTYLRRVYLLTHQKVTQHYVVPWGEVRSGKLFGSMQ